MNVHFGGIDDPEVGFAINRILRPGDWAIDGGAHHGRYTVQMAQLVGPTGFVWAFEPGENNWPFLERNLCDLKLENVEVVRKPLWSERKQVELHMCVDGSKNALAAHGDTIRATAIEAVVLREYTVNARLIKLDIEGAEEAALRGAGELVGRCPYIIAEANMKALPKFGSSIERLCAFMREKNYAVFLLHTNDRLPTFVPPGVEIVPYNPQQNVMRLNLNLLFSTFEHVAEAWPEVICG